MPTTNKDPDCVMAETYTQEREHENIHAELGCWGCSFADMSAVRRHMPCCGRMRGPSPDPDTGKCTTHKPDAADNMVRWNGVPKPRKGGAE